MFDGAPGTHVAHRPTPLADLRTAWSLWRLMRRIRLSHVLSYTIRPVIYGTLASLAGGGGQQRFALITGLGYVNQVVGSIVFQITSHEVAHRFDEKKNTFRGECGLVLHVPSLANSPGCATGGL